MSEELKPNQALFLWNLLTAETTEEREPMKKNAKPDLKKDFAPLVQRGYLAIEKRGRAGHLILTDKAWAWAEQTGDVRLLQSNSKIGAQALERLLRRLIPFLLRNNIPLAALLATQGDEAPPETPQPTSPSKREPAALALLIEQACLRLTGGRRKERVSLRELRLKLNTVPRAELDDALLQLQRDGKLVLFREDNSPVLTRADHEAALIVGDSPRHIVYLEN